MGNFTPQKRLKRRSRIDLRCETLDDRIVPAALVPSNLPATSTEIVAQTTSKQPLQDLANIVSFLDLSSQIDVSRSAIVIQMPSFSGVATSTLQIALRSGANSQTVVQTLSQLHFYDSVTPNYIYSRAADLREKIPNDPKFVDQYHHPIIHTPQAWDKTVGSPGVIVAILDDGVDINHADLKDNVWVNRNEVPNDGIDNDGNGFIDDANGWDFVHDTSNVFPDDAIRDTHGTEVAGLLAGRIDNATGITGVAGRITYLPLKVVGSGSTTSLTFARAVAYAVQNGAKIINNSLNIDSFVGDPTFQSAVSFAYNRGLLWVNSAGNENISNAARQAFEEMILVAATDRNDVKTSYSNYGSGIDIAAPGGTSSDGLVTTIPQNAYGTAFGTSVATPLVAGTAALIWSAFPGYSRDKVAAALIANADDIAANNMSFIDMLGSGRVNAAKAVSGAPFVTKLGRLTGLPDEGASAPSSIAGFSLRLNSPLNPNTVIDSNFELRWAGMDNQFGTSDDELIPFAINGGRSYKIGTNGLDFTVGAELERGLYRFTAKSGGLTDPFGNAVDGDGNGTAGGNLVRNFGVAYQASGRVYEDINNDGFQNPSDPGLKDVVVFGDTNGNGRFDNLTFQSTNGVNIPDANPAGVSLPISVSGAGVIGSISTSIYISHSRPSELTITLVSPDGDRVVLYRNGDIPEINSPGFHIFKFEDGIEERAELQPTIVQHFVRPVEPLSKFIGKNASGIWRVEVSDNSAGNTGSVAFASIALSSEPTARTDANGFFHINGLPPGTTRISIASATGYQRAANGGAISVDLSGPNPPAPISIGLSRINGITGRVLRDNGDGVFGPTDAGIAGVIVYLDANANGIPDGVEQTTTTDSFGNFTFGNLGVGTFTVRYQNPPGFSPVASAPTTRTVNLTAETPLVTGNDFLFVRETAPVRVQLSSIAPIRNAPLESVAISLSEPLPGFGIANVALTRNGVPVSLAGTTLLGSGTQYTLIGLKELTRADGVYALTINAPAPTGMPGRQPSVITATWTMDGIAPTLNLIATTNPTTGNVTGGNLTFTKPVTGVTLADFVLVRNGIIVPIDSAIFSGSGATYNLALPQELVVVAGDYVLRLVAIGSGIRDSAGNDLAANSEITWTVTAPPVVTKLVARTVIATGEGGPGRLNIYDTANGRFLINLVPFESGFTGGIRVATGDVNGDGVEDIIVAAGPGGGPRVRIYDGAKFTTIADFMAFESEFTGGLFVSAGDFNGDRKADIVVSPDTGGGPRVTIFDAVTLMPIANFFGIDDPAFRGGARTTVGDINHDGTPDLIVAAGTGGGPRLAGYDGKSILSGLPTKLFQDFFAFEPGLRDGVFVSSGDFNADGFADIVIGAGAGAGPRLLILDGNALATAGLLQINHDFFAGDPTSRAGVRIAVKDIDGDGRPDIYAANGVGGSSAVRIYYNRDLGTNPPPLGDTFDDFPGFTGGIFVG